jgi:acetyltransferase-like isoleucine patch superfamily enzyme
MDHISTYPCHHDHLFSHKQGNGSSFSRGDITIHNDVWIGANCTILDNVTIGNGAVVAAGSVVINDVPPYAIVGGNPAKVIKYRFSSNQIDALLRIQWWNMSNLPNIHTNDIDSFIQEFDKP